MKKYDGWLVSDSFWKRMWAIFGYSLLGNIIVWGSLYLLLLLLILLISAI